LKANSALVFIIALLLAKVNLYAKTPGEWITELGLDPSSKTQSSWDKTFNSDGGLDTMTRKKLGIDKVASGDKDVLLSYLKEHAKDGPKPGVPGM
jgi:hypothetical protein